MWWLNYQNIHERQLNLSTSRGIIADVIATWSNFIVCVVKGKTNLILVGDSIEPDLAIFKRFIRPISLYQWLNDESNEMG